jgi:hypothetical protein
MANPAGETNDGVLRLDFDRRLMLRSGLPVHQHRLHRPAAQERDQDQHGWERRLARQHLRRAPVADHQIRGGVPTGLPSVPEHGPPSADISTPFTMPEGPIRALTGGCRMRPTSLRCSQSRLQHNHGRNPLSRSQPAVQTNRASSIHWEQPILTGGYYE